METQDLPCDAHHCGTLRQNRSMFCGILMNMKLGRGFALLVIVLVWAMTPAVACASQGSSLTPAERECCMQMAEHCDSTMMPASHSCCRAPANRNATLNAGQTAAPVRQFVALIVPVAVPTPALPAIAPHAMFSWLHSPPSEPSAGCSSVLRI